MKEIAYLHLSDLHIGDRLQKTILSSIKNEVKDDVVHIIKKLGRLDFIFFTGDLVQTGSKEEYSKFRIFLEDILNLIEKMGYKPIVLFVPGNHDLERINNPDDSTHQMMTSWVNNLKLRQEMFWKTDSQYINYIQQRFQNYSDFVKEYNNKQNIEIEIGSLPGDFYYHTTINDINFGIVGLNSSFLQVEGGDFKKKVGVYNNQICGVFSDVFIDRIKTNDINILMTHHAPSWYESESLSEYKQEIYHPDFFVEHICGHNHEPQSFNSNENFTGERRLTIAPSLCGLEKYEDNFTRIHGYHAGKFIIEEDGTIKKQLYPRLSTERNNGYRIDKDVNYNCKKGEEYIDIVLSTPKEVPNCQLDTEEMLIEAKSNKANLIQPSILKDCGIYTEARIEQQEHVKNSLESTHYVWVVSHYLLGEEQFISSVLQRMCVTPDSVFIVNCEDVFTFDQFENQIRERFSVSIGKLVSDLSSVVNTPILVFTNLQEEFISQNINQIKTTTLSMVNFCDNIMVILVSSTTPSTSYFESIELQQLTQEEVKRCITKALPKENFNVFDFEKIYNLTNGYPLCIDILCKKLRYVSLDDLDESDFSLYQGDIPIPIATIEYIKSIKKSNNPSERNCYKLLLLMSLLPKGEVFSNIKRFDSTSPFRGDELDALIDKELLSVEVYYIIKNNELIKQPKVLRIPKIYRDYVLSLEDAESCRTVNTQICSLYLGESWHQFNIKIKHTGIDEYFPFTYYNVESALKSLLQFSVENGDSNAYVKYLTIGGNYLHYLEKGNLYYVGLYIANDIYQSIQDVECTEEAKGPLSFFKFKLANLERMNGYPDRCLPLFKEVLEEGLLAKHFLQSCRECLAYAYTKKNDTEKALYYADQLLENESNKKTSLNALIAQYIKAVNIIDIDKRLKQLKAVYKTASRIKEANLISANAALEISLLVKDKSTIKMIDTELRNNNSRYQRMQLIVRKYSMYSESSLQMTLDDSDIQNVKVVYIYAFMQMLEPILADSHNILWHYYLRNKRYEDFVEMLRYSFFVWEMCNNSDKIHQNIELVKSDADLMSWIRANQNNEDVAMLIREHGI